jgi:arylsulfatase A-like enzyme
MIYAKIRFLLQFVALLAAFVGVAPFAIAEDAPQTRPNIVLVLIDDMGWGDFSCFGNKSAETPNIDRLAAEGQRFEQFYVASPICSPSRVALSTGQYPQRWRITSFLNHRKANEERGMAQWLDPKAPMLARALKHAGYATGHFGKWHLGGQRDVGDAPMIGEYGFDQSLTNFEGLGPRVLPLLDAYDGAPARLHALGSNNLAHGPIRQEKRDRVTTSFASAAIDFIERAQADKRPFYINLWPDDVHSPFFPPKPRRGDGTKRELYLGVLETMDEQLKPFFDRIREDESLRNNTIILVCSDNGPEEGAGSAGPFRGTKATLYDGGVRSPMIVWAPGHMRKDAVGQANNTSVVSAIDIAPSLLEIVNVASNDEQQLDGEPLAAVLLGKSEESRTKPLFFRRPPDRANDPLGNDLPDLAVRFGRWKLLCEYDGSEPQLYNVVKDRGERRNVADDHPKVVKRLTKQLIAWHQQMPADQGANYAQFERASFRKNSTARAGK